MPRSLAPVFIVMCFLVAAGLAFGPQLGTLFKGETAAPASSQSEQLNAPPQPDPNSNDGGKVMSGLFTLALSWQPAFCEQRSQKPECTSQTATRADATQLSLHGLWPEPRGNEYCGVSNTLVQLDKRGDWHALPKLALTEGTRTALAKIMPGMQSHLHRHEWIKHGTCAGVDTETYFVVSIALTNAINQSGFADMLETAIGQTLSAQDVRDAFSAAFGGEAGGKLSVECAADGNRRLIDELRISVSGNISATTDLATALNNAPSRQRGCPQGEIDRVGLQ